MGLALPWRSAGQSSEYADCVESGRNMVVLGGEGIGLRSCQCLVLRGAHAWGGGEGCASELCRYPKQSLMAGRSRLSAWTQHTDP